jgi:hypothetical protein
MWTKTSKEASVYETNFKASMQLMLSNNEVRYESANEEIKGDGVPSIENSNSLKQRRSSSIDKRGIPSSKFLNCEEMD